MRKISKWLVISGGALVIVIIIIVFLIQRRSTNQELYQTLKLERGSLVSTIGATGIVRSNQTANLSWQSSGTVGSVHFSLGEQINKGEVLAQISSESLPQNIILAQADLVNAQRNLDNLINSKISQAQAMVSLANAQKAYDDAEYQRDSLSFGRNNEEGAANAEAQYIIAKNNLESAQAAYDRVAGFSDDNPVKAQAYSTLYAARQLVKAKLDAWNWYKSQASNQDIAEADAQFALAEAKLADAHREWDRLKEGPDPSDIAAAQARVTAAQASLNASSIIAPFAGIITNAVPLPGDQVSPGMPAFRIDDFSRLSVDVQVSEVDINSVKTGQDVTLTFDAIIDVTFHGKVIQVSPVGTSSQGSVSFNVTVELSDSDPLVKPGMTSAVTIIVNQLENILLVPNRAVRMVENQRVIYILKNGKPTEIKILLGATSGIDSEVLEGDLKEGDLIILNPSSNFGSGEQMRPGGGGMFGG